MTTFRGCAHPRDGVCDGDLANLNSAEISVTDLSNRPVLFEHDASKKIGVCTASWQGLNGELRVAGTITNDKMAEDVRSGRYMGLSLGTDCVTDAYGKCIYKTQQELSICNEPRRYGCYIDVLDGVQVRHKRDFSSETANWNKHARAHMY
jgi:hypothetical protein